MTLNDPPDHDDDGKRDKHFGMLKAYWDEIVKRENAVNVYLNGGHIIHGTLLRDKKGYVVKSTLSVTYLELGDAVAVEEYFDSIDDGGDCPF